MTLDRKDFSHQCWNGCNRSNQDLSGYKLVRTQINGGNLRNSILDGARLEHAELCGADLTNASLRGANLRNASLEYAQLNGVDFGGADVQGTRFKNNTGLMEETKKILKERGAIFDDSTNTVDLKWWIKNLLIPLTALIIGSGGIMGIWLELSKQISQPPPLSIEVRDDQLKQRL